MQAKIAAVGERLIEAPLLPVFVAATWFGMIAAIPGSRTQRLVRVEIYAEGGMAIFNSSLFYPEFFQTFRILSESCSRRVKHVPE
jgi:hypothetical protein